MFKPSYFVAIACAVFATRSVADDKATHDTLRELDGANSTPLARRSGTSEIPTAKYHAAFHAAAGVPVVQPAQIIGGGDCNDVDPAVSPGHAEVLFNLRDDDCDRLADEDINNNPSTNTQDLDGDGVTIASNDCDDTALSTHPGAQEVVGNFVDDDCDGLTDEDNSNNPSNDTADHDNDNYMIAPDLLFRSGFDL